jgi:hypothetical protein
LESEEDEEKKKKIKSPVLSARPQPAKPSPSPRTDHDAVAAVPLPSSRSAHAQPSRQRRRSFSALLPARSSSVAAQSIEAGTSPASSPSHRRFPLHREAPLSGTQAAYSSHHAQSLAAAFAAAMITSPARPFSAKGNKKKQRKEMELAKRR